MSNELLGILLFFLIGFAWIIYLSQEIFISGAGLLNGGLPKNDKERKQLQVISGLHFDGMEVWFIAAESLLFGVFPLAYAMTFTYLYIPMFLLIFAIIGRGVSIEVIYKLDDPRWVKFNFIVWLISSILIVFIFGVYHTHLFQGFPIGAEGMEEGILHLFNVTTISGGLLFTALSFVSGAAWTKLMTTGDIGDRAMKFIKRVALPVMVPVLVLLVIMGLNNSHTSLFTGELFTKAPALFILPGLTVLAGLMVIYYGYKEKARQLFIHSIAVMVLFMITGFVGIYPNVIPSSVDSMYAITITDAMSGQKALSIIFWVVAIFFPVIIGYQSWKYLRFKDKVKLNDE